jgi:hypothetical protein
MPCHWPEKRAHCKPCFHRATRETARPQEFARPHEAGTGAVTAFGRAETRRPRSVCGLTDSWGGAGSTGTRCHLLGTGVTGKEGWIRDDGRGIARQETASESCPVTRDETQEHGVLSSGVNEHSEAHEILDAVLEEYTIIDIIEISNRSQSLGKRNQTGFTRNTRVKIIHRVNPDCT